MAVPRCLILGVVLSSLDGYPFLNHFLALSLSQEGMWKEEVIPMHVEDTFLVSLIGKLIVFACDLGGHAEVLLKRLAFLFFFWESEQFTNTFPLLSK